MIANLLVKSQQAQVLANRTRCDTNLLTGAEDHPREPNEGFVDVPPGHPSYDAGLEQIFAPDPPPVPVRARMAEDS